MWQCFRRGFCVFFALSTLTSVLIEPNLSAAQAISSLPKGVVRADESDLRRAAIHTEIPKYPSSSIRHSTTGVVVVLIEIDHSGNVSECKLLRVPDPAIGKSVTNAVKSWKFSPMKMNGAPVLVSGKLTFYFTNLDGKFVVLNPDQMPAKAGF